MSTVNKREELKKAYPNSKSWWARVDKMSESQVVAIYLKLKRQGKVAMAQRAPSITIKVMN